MCWTILINSAHCDHRHTELQKCSKIIAKEAKRSRNFLRKLFSPHPKPCDSVQERSTCTRAQVCPNCTAAGITYEQIRNRRDSGQLRKPPPIHTPGNPIPTPPPILQGKGTRRTSTDQRPQARTRNNTVQFEGMAPQLPNVRATAIYRGSQNVDQETLRQYLGTPGVPSEDPFQDPPNTAYQRPPFEDPFQDPPNTGYQRPPISDGYRSHSRNPEPSPSNMAHPPQHHGSIDKYKSKPLPPLPLQPQKKGAASSWLRSSTQQRPNALSDQVAQNSAPSRSPWSQPSKALSHPSSQGYSKLPKPSRSALDHGSSPRRFNSTKLPRAPMPSVSETPLQRPPQLRPPPPPPGPLSSRRPLQPLPTMDGSTSPPLPQAPEYYHGMPTDKALNRMSREIAAAEEAWLNGPGGSSPQHRPQRTPIDSFLSPRNHRNQRNGKYA